MRMGTKTPAPSGNGHNGSRLHERPSEGGNTHAGDSEARAGVESILRMVGEDPSREGLKETPSRVVKAFRELCRGYAQDPKKILGTTFREIHPGMVVVSGIRFSSLCEHHLLPFTGDCAIAYLPGNRVVGLSKIPRLVECFAARLQVQERLTNQIAQALQQHLDPRGVAVLIRSHHSCMGLRGVRCAGSMATTAFLGEMGASPHRQEFFTLAGGTLTTANSL